MWQSILALIAAILPSIPSLVTDAENIFRSKPKSGVQKAASVINFVAPLIASMAGEIARLAPAGTDAAKIATAVETYTKAVNDATVTLANDLGVFPHSSTPAS
jgi:hypothetical protein